MHIERFNERVSDVFSLLHECIEIVIVSAADSDALASISHHLLIINGSQNLNHLVDEVRSLKGTDDTLVLSEAGGHATDQILHE
jgi:hypothetical protein